MSSTRFLRQFVLTEYENTLQQHELPGVLSSEFDKVVEGPERQLRPIPKADGTGDQSATRQIGPTTEERACFAWIDDLFDFEVLG